jgi:hypothetical protein
MLTENEVLELKEKALDQISYLMDVQKDLVENQEFQMARLTKDKIMRYRRDVKILDKVLCLES